MGKFADDIKQFTENAEGNMRLFVIKIALDMFTLIVKRSPVDTGRFRANNQISLNSLPSSAVMEFDKSGGVTIRNGNAVLGSYKLGDSIFLYNNLSYALALEFGHSKQAPAGVYRLSLSDIATQLGMI